MKTKICTDCKEEKSIFLFPKGGKKYILERCTACNTRRTLANINRNRARTDDEIQLPETKLCGTCKQTKVASDYYPNRGLLDGLQHSCKVCDAVRGKRSINKLPTVVRKIRGMLSNCRGRDTAKRLGFDLDEPWLIEQFAGLTHCPILGMPIRWDRVALGYDSPSLDRYDNSKGYTKDNVWIISRKANTMKNDASFTELLAFSKYWIGRLE